MWRLTIVSALVLAPAVVRAAGASAGLDLLYGEQVTLGPTGEPLVSVGLMEHQSEIRLSSAHGLRIDYYEASVAKRTTVAPGDELRVTILRQKPGVRAYYADVEGVPFGDRDALSRTVSGWKARGYANATVIEEGVVLGLSGRVVDNRQWRVTLPAKSQADAKRVVEAVYDAFGTRAAVKARLAQKPWAELKLEVGGAAVAKATSFIRVVAQSGGVSVRAVEFGRGYGWHGFEDRSFRGELYVAVDTDGTLAAVNVLGVEDILRGVVPAEIYASSPPEALKAQAVAARNHLLGKLGKEHHDDPFRLCSEQHCQVYGGMAKEDERTSQAVDATYGKALFLGKYLVPAVYSSSCGGHTEDNEVVWGDAPIAALRGRPDVDGEAPGDLSGERMRAWIESKPAAYCLRASSSRPERFRWQKALSVSEAQTLVQKVYPNLGVLQDVVVEERGAGGRIIALKLVGSRSTARVLHELPIRQLFGNLFSGAFVIDSAKDARGKLASLTFSGAGWGHGVGMCQLGAVGRAEAGQLHTDILSYYFNGAALEQLYKPRE